MAHPLDKVVQHIRSVAASQGATDGELLRAFSISGDQAAFAALAHRHGPLVLAVCKRILGNLEDAEDAFQATFVVLARNAGKLPQKGSLSSWLHGVAYRIALNARRLSARRRKHERQAKIMVTTNPAWNAAWREVQLLLDEEVQRLPEKYRDPFILCCLESQSYAAAARRMGVKEGTVGSRLAEARKRLQRRLTQRGVELTAVLAAAALAACAARAQVAPALIGKAVSAATSAAVPASVMALVKGLTVSLAIKKVKVSVALFVIFSAMAGTASMWAVQQGGQEKAPGAQTPRKQEAAVKAEPAVAKDLYGDPLPTGAVARLGALRFRLEGWPRFLAFTPDGKSLVGLTPSGIFVWDAATGKERHRLLASPFGGHTGALPRVAVSPDGTTLAIPENVPESNEAQIGLWDLSSGKRSRRFSVPEGGMGLVTHLSFAPDSKSLALCYFDADSRGKAGIFELGSFKVRASLSGPNLFFYNLAISPNGKTIAAAVHSKEGKEEAETTLQLWDIATGKLLRTVQNLSSDDHVGAIAYSPDGKLLAFGANGRLYLFATETGKVTHLKTENMGLISELAFTPDGKKLLSCSLSSSEVPDGKIRVWNVADGTVLHTFEGKDKGGMTMALSPDGKVVGLGAFRNTTLQFWDVASGEEVSIERPGHCSEIWSVAYSPDGKTLVSASGRFGQMQLWDSTTWKWCGNLPGSAHNISYSPNGKYLASMLADSKGVTDKVRVWNMSVGKEQLVLTVPDVTRVESAAFSHDGRKLVTLDYKSLERDYMRPCVRSWDVGSGKQEQMFQILPSLKTEWFPFLSSDGRTVLQALEGGVLSIHDVESGYTRLFRGHETETYWSHAISPVGGIIASATKGQNGGVRLWEFATGREILVLQGDAGTPIWSPDGRLLAAGNKHSENRQPIVTQTVWLWDTATGEELASFSGFKSDVSALAFAPNGKNLVAGLGDGTILVFDISKVRGKPALVVRMDYNQFHAHWTDLGGENAAKAHQALWLLVGAPKESVPFLRDRLKPVTRLDGSKVRQWITNLDSDKFAVRQAAAKELEKVGEQVRPFIQDAVKGNLTLETQRRLEQILNVVSDTPSPETLRTIRAIMALERIGSPDAQAVLRTLAGGAPGACETEEAKAWLERRSQRTSRAP
jgi:RNA polymerase sigma factor (sigma-70 family)